MKVKLAKTAGFCMGVRRALEMVLRVSHEHAGPVTTHGPLIHNPQVLGLLETLGVRPLAEDEECSSGCVVIRAHGVPLRVKSELEKNGVDMVDATCPHVIRVQVILNKYTGQGYRGLIVGDADHPEVVGLLGHSNGRGMVIGEPEELDALDPDGPAVLVAQTTQHEGKYQEIAAHARARFKNLKVFDTICGATHRRQSEVQALAEQVECMVVVGGKNSGNTRRLATIAADTGVPTMHVETDEELDEQMLSAVGTVGVTAGASTPNWMIKQVVQRLERIRGRDESFLRYGAVRLVKFLMQSDLYVALGAAALCYASVSLMGLNTSPSLPVFLVVSAFYLYSVHMLNRFLDKEATRYNDPDRSRFFDRYRKVLIGTGLASGGCALLLTWFLGLLPFLFLLLLSALGLVYSLPVIPASWFRRRRIRRLKDIPASKTLSIAAGWGAATTVLPALAVAPDFDLTIPVALVFVVVLVFMRSVLIEFMDIQGDLIVGSETTPIFLGEKNALRLLFGLGALLLVLMPLMWVAHLGPSLFIRQVIPCLFALGYVAAFERKDILLSERFVFLVESNFIVAGLVAYSWNHWF